jgi:hypothetical protein
MTPLTAPALDLCAIPGVAVGCAAKAVAGAVTAGALPSPAGAAAGMATSIASSMMESLAAGFFNAWWLLQSQVLTFWVDSPTPGPADLVAPGSTRGWVAWLAQFALIVSVLVAAGRTILTRDGRNLAEAGRAVVMTILTSALAVTVAAALVRAGDAIANNLLDAALLEGFMSAPQPAPAALATLGGPPGMLLLTLVGLLVSAVQFILLLGRNAILPVVIALLPLAAAAGGVQVGRAWFGRLVAWLLALAFYKPVAALIYSIVLVQARTADTALKVLTALAGMVLAVVTLPALIKLFTPSAAGGGGGGGAGYAAGMAAGAVVRATAARR